ncbi:MAG: sulfite exporter TauE/SafE family protein [SAR324 cluster bacterium]|nr:sulfite exporter TauE/SafE family protein [SAR324 cluster bacterium]
MDINLVPLIVFSFLSYLSVAFAGFGGILIPITLGAHFYPIRWMLPVLLPLTLLLNLYILLRHFRQINRSILFRQILPFMGVGLVIGMVIFNRIHGELLVEAFGILVVVMSLRELVQLFRSDRTLSPIGRFEAFLYIFAAGIVHGIYASGGPLLVYIVNRFNLKKSEFRSTLSVVWLIMNIFLSISYVLTNRITLETGRISLLLLPSLVLGIFLGEYLHEKSDGRKFKIVVFTLLLLTGVSIILK